ncbi:XRE family transcriptional regulator [Pseudoflavonifractor sp. 524-17]|uniref:helix-turn-helix domain-containing protein n=1 Tax=Pseudoflavonifractor sp. 524-17 TaxID=2304577 RepID=UPI00137A4BE1|nr:helix-turn-helix transcriptional regulator [Pseudoflavonifractor sp. 524-17]NCE65382.1 XRE family transcriptional regulator [Pseudoflavonifractor sp. 524-17]
MDVGGRLVALREEKGYTTNRLANLAGVSQSFLREIEHRRKRPTVDTLALLCDALDISLRDFFDEGGGEAEEELLRLIRRMTPQQRESLLAFLRTL